MEEKKIIVEQVTLEEQAWISLGRVKFGELRRKISVGDIVQT